jgi:hypothetical protein
MRMAKAALSDVAHGKSRHPYFYMAKTFAVRR